MAVQLNFKNLAVAATGVFFVYLIFVLWGPNRVSLLPDLTVDVKELINYSILAAYQGGNGVRAVHREGESLGVKSKGLTKEGAKELLTRADLLSNALILETFERVPGLRIVSEEKTPMEVSKIESYRLNPASLHNQYKARLAAMPSKRVRLSDVTIWVDPLDATQEFTEGLLEYVTVMVCMALKGKPVFGLIYRPFQNELILGYVGTGIDPPSYVYHPTKPPATLATEFNPRKIVVSRSHTGNVKAMADKVFLDGGGKAPEVEPAGGAGYKVLRVLNGTADAYIHTTAIKKWDICAGNAIIEATGSGRMTTLYGDPISYYPDEPVVNEKGLLVTRAWHYSVLKKVKGVVDQFVGH